MPPIATSIPTTTDRRIIVAAIIAAAGYSVCTTKLSASPRCAWVYPDIPAVRTLVDAFDSGQPVPVAQSAIWIAYKRLATEARQLQQGRIGGAV